MRYELGLVGGGNMAEAIVRAVVDGKIVAPGKIIVSDPQPARRDLMAKMGVHVTESNREVITGAAQVMLAVKPQTVAQLGPELTLIDVEQQVVLSIMAGVSTKKIAAAVGRPTRIVRIMPNTPLMIGRGMSGIAVGLDARPGDEALSLRIFRAAGEAVIVREEELDAVTAVSGSGPAYVFYLAEAMAEAAKSLGLGDEAGRLLTQQTILGAAELLVKSADSPQELRRKVTSPGGTTQAAIEHMEQGGVKQRIVDALGKAAARSRELGK
jgi:pyrroline-5-carboxylate reductase